MKKIVSFLMTATMLLSVTSSAYASNDGEIDRKSILGESAMYVDEVIYQPADSIGNDIIGMGKYRSEDEQLEDFELDAVVSTKNYKENLFNNILDSVDYYDAVEGAFVTTLWREDGERTTISYGSDINAQKSYQNITAEGEEYRVIVSGGEKITIDLKNKTKKVDNIGVDEESTSRTKQTARIYDVAKFTNDKDRSVRVGDKNGSPIYYYRNDLTNCDYAAVSIFPQTLAFGLLTNFDNWEVVDVDTLFDRSAIVIKGVVSDPVYSEKINSSVFKLVIDVKTGIVLEFVGYDEHGNETESIKTTEISVVENAMGKSTEVEAFVNAILNEYNSFDEIKREHSLSSANVNRSAVSTSSISETIDNDTIDSNCFNSRQGFWRI